MSTAKNIGGSMATRKDHDLLDDYCPRCSAYTAGDSVCPNCGAKIFDDTGLEEVDEEDGRPVEEEEEKDADPDEDEDDEEYDEDEEVTDVDEDPDADEDLDDEE
jgi:uncharacterized Zn finger protein (UPF0148 family)